MFQQRSYLFMLFNCSWRLVVAAVITPSTDLFISNQESFHGLCEMSLCGMPLLYSFQCLIYSFLLLLLPVFTWILLSWDSIGWSQCDWISTSVILMSTTIELVVQNGFCMYYKYSSTTLTFLSFLISNFIQFHAFIFSNSFFYISFNDTYISSFSSCCSFLLMQIIDFSEGYQIFVSMFFPYISIYTFVAFFVFLPDVLM